MEDDYVLISAPNLPTTPTVSSSSAPSHLSTISTYIDHLSPELRHLSLLIHDNPELNYKEYKAYALLVKFFKALEGWEVEEKACGIDTAFIAVFDNRKAKGKDGSQGEVVSFNAEYGEFVFYFKQSGRHGLWRRRSKVQIACVNGRILIFLDSRCSTRNRSCLRA